MFLVEVSRPPKAVPNSVLILFPKRGKKFKLMFWAKTRYNTYVPKSFFLFNCIAADLYHCRLGIGGRGIKVTPSLLLFVKERGKSSSSLI